MKKSYFLFVALLISLHGFAQNCLTFSFNGTAPVAPTATAAGIGGTGTIQTYTVPAGVTAIRIEANGAQGGRTPDFPGGNGRKVTATYAVTAGDVLHILVGGKGGDGAADNNVLHRSAAGGGGGTFVSKGPLSTGKLLVAAGGGGGAGDQGGGGVSNDSPGSGSASIAAGGGSFSTDGSTSIFDNDCGKGGKAIINGGNGGANTCFKIETNGGGYGGGGAGNYEVGRNNAGGGGGGGYSGGNAGGVAGGNGGGSYTDSTATNIVKSTNTQENGFVTIIIVGGTHNITWNGAVNTDWANPCNWTPNGVPTATNPVVIPNVANKPVISSGTTASCLVMTIGNSTTLTINSGGVLNVLPTVASSTGIAITSSGILTNNGTITATTTGNIDLISIADNATFNNNGTINLSTPFSAILLGGPNSAVNNNTAGIVNFQGGVGFRTLSGTTGNVITNQGIVNYTAGGACMRLNLGFALNNSGTIRVTRGVGVLVEGGTLNNLACGKIFISNTDYGLDNSVIGSLTTNAGLIVSQGIANTNGTFNNTGVTNRLPTTGTVTNTGNAAVFVKNLTYPIFAYGGTFNGTINGIFTDSLATISAGTFIAPQGFTPLATLPRGVQTLYVKITPSGGACSYVVPFIYNTLTSSVSKIDALALELQQNRPNPFNQETLISFTLPETNKAILTVFDITGRQVFFLNQGFKSGYNEVIVNKSVFPTSGTYFYRLTTDKYAAVKRMQFIAE